MDRLSLSRSNDAVVLDMHDGDRKGTSDLDSPQGLTYDGRTVTSKDDDVVIDIDDLSQQGDNSRSPLLNRGETPKQKDSRVVGYWRLARNLIKIRQEHDETAAVIDEMGGVRVDLKNRYDILAREVKQKKLLMKSIERALANEGDGVSESEEGSRRFGRRATYDILRVVSDDMARGSFIALFDEGKPLDEAALQEKVDGINNTGTTLERAGRFTTATIEYFAVFGNAIKYFWGVWRTWKVYRRAMYIAQHDGTDPKSLPPLTKHLDASSYRDPSPETVKRVLLARNKEVIEADGTTSLTEEAQRLRLYAETIGAQQQRYYKLFNFVGSIASLAMFAGILINMWTADPFFYLFVTAMGCVSAIIYFALNGVQAIQRRAFKQKAMRSIIDLRAAKDTARDQRDCDEDCQKKRLAAVEHCQLKALKLNPLLVLASLWIELKKEQFIEMPGSDIREADLPYLTAPELQQLPFSITSRKKTIYSFLRTFGIEHYTIESIGQEENMIDGIHRLEELLIIKPSQTPIEDFWR